ncbi:MAG: SDR family oxidoreductase [Candidatus Binatia bacterium]
MEHSLAGQVALITGASRGIGRAIATRLAHEGVAVALAARTESDLHAVADNLTTSCAPVTVLPTDVTDDKQIVRLTEQTLTQFGHIDILVNNAGSAPPRTPTLKARLLDWERTLRVNLWAAMHLTRLVLPTMIARRKGTIINLCSVAGLTGKAGEAAYAAAKFGIRGFSQALFEEVRQYGIKVCVLCPGYVDTTLIPHNRRIDRNKMLTPEDVADAAFNVIVASPRSCPTEIILQPQYDPFGP